MDRTSRVTIPAELRKQLGLIAGTPLNITVKAGAICLTLARSDKKLPVQKGS